VSYSQALKRELVLAKLPLFEGLPEERLHSLALASRRARFEKGEQIVSEGDPGHSMFVILSGQAAVGRTNEDGVRVHFRDLKKGDFFGELSMLSGGTRTADVFAVTACACIVIREEQFVEVLLQSPETSRKIIQNLLQTIFQADADRTFRPSVRGRAIRLLLQMASSEPNDGPLGLGEGLCVEISRQAIADKIGSKRETVSRELSGLVRSGHLRIGGRKIFLLKPKELRELIK
jgi:CRP/FNR family transcriptional regulator, cyclic AMP receptor protein